MAFCQGSGPWIQFPGAKFNRKLIKYRHGNTYYVPPYLQRLSISQLPTCIIIDMYVLIPNK